MSKKVVSVVLETVSLYDLDGPLDVAINFLQEIKKRYPGKDIQLDVRSKEYGEGSEYAVVERREENEIEYQKRLEEEKKGKEYRLLQYQRLKKEFEGE